MANNGILKAGREWITINNSYYYNYWWDFSWTSKKESAGKTKVNWELRAYGREGKNNTQIYTVLNVIAVYNNSNNTIYSTSPPPGSVITYTGMTQATGSFIVNHSNNGSGEFTIKFDFQKIYDVWENFDGDTNTTVQLDKNSPLISCTPPSTITVTPAIQKPNGEITVNWSGATCGNDDSIKDYYVGYRIGENDWYTEVADSSAKSHNFTLPSNASRGQNIEVRVRTRSASDTERDSGYAYGSNTSKVNTLPGKPTIKISGSTDLSAGAATITATAGASNDSEQTASVRYKIGDGSFTIYRNTINVNQAGTYEFRTYDGLEYGPAITQVFTRKIDAPVVTAVSIDGEVLESVNNYTHDYDSYPYIISPLISIATEKPHENGQQYKLRLKYNKVFKEENFGEDEGLDIGVFDSPTIQIEDIRKFIAPTLEYGYRYKIEVTGTNGTQESIGRMSQKFRLITRLPAFRLQGDNQNSEEDPFFSEKIRPVFEKDTGYSGLTLIAKKNKTIKEWKAGCNFGETVGYRTIAVDELTRGETYDFSVKLRSSSFTSEEISCGSKTRVFLPIFDNIEISPSLFKPLNPENTNITFRNFFMTEKLEENKGALYGIQIKEKQEFFQVELKVSYKNQTGSISKNCQALSADILSISLDSQDISDLFKNIQATSNITVNFTLQIDTKYSKQIVSNNISVGVEYLNNGTAPEFDNANGISFSLEYNDSVPKIWTEDCILKINNIALKSVYELSKINIYAMKGVINQTIDLTDKITLKDRIYTIDPLEIITPKNNKDIGSDEHTIILTIYNIVNQSVSKEFVGKVNASVKSLTNGIGEIISAPYSLNNKELVVNFNISNFGTGIGINSITNDLDYASFTARIYYYNKTENKYKSLMTGNNGYLCRNLTFNEGSLIQTGSFTLTSEQENLFNSGLLKIKIKCTTRIWPSGAPKPIINGEETNCIKSVWWSPEFTVYNFTPTISYRKNKVGVNYNFSNDIGNESVLVVQAHEPYNTVVLTNGERIITINLTTSTIDGAIINCGSW